MHTRLSAYGQASTRPAPVSQMMAQFSQDFRDGVDINLGVGYVNENTIPVDLLRESLEAVAAQPQRYRQAFNYGSPAGSANLQQSLRRFLLRMQIGRLDEATLDSKQLAIGPCGATSVLDALTEIMPKGIVVTSDPMYYIYCEALERKGFEVLAIPEDAEGLGLEELDRKLAQLGSRRDEISFFYVVTVNNPSATMLSNRRRRELLEVATRVSRELNRRVPIFYDLAYELLLHDVAAEPFVSVLGCDELEIAYEIGTLSKILAPALRMGYLLGPRGALMDAMVQATSDTGFSAPLFVQEMASYLLDHHIEAQLEAVTTGYREKALAVRQGLQQWLGGHLEACSGGSAGFYFYLTFARLETHPQSAFFRYLTRSTGDPLIDGPQGALHPRVLYIPGEYCVHPRGDLVEPGRRQLRLSYGFEDSARIVEALRLMREAAEAVS